MPRKRIIHKEIVENEIVIIPSYKDFHKTGRWKFLKNKYNLLIYEKIDGLEKEEKINDFHYRIPSYGEGCMAFIYHIVKNYDNLEDKIHYTKTHWIPNESNPVIFMKDLKKKENYYHHWIKRDFVLFFDDLRSLGGPEAVKKLLGKDIKIKFYNRNPNCNQCQDEKKCLACGHIMIEGDEYKNTLFEFSNLFAGCYTIDKLREIFPKFNRKTELKRVAKEGSFSVAKELILKHPLSVYEDILENICKPKRLCRDSMILFLQLFFEETINI